MYKTPLRLCKRQLKEKHTAQEPAVSLSWDFREREDQDVTTGQLLLIPRPSKIP